MRKFGGAVAVAAAVSTLASAGAASAAVTLGSVTEPSTAGSGPCQSGSDGAAFVQLTSDPSTPYSVPSPGGEITAWQTNTTGATEGASLEFIVARPESDGSYDIVGVDPETLPDPLPPSGVASFTLATPIAVDAGDVIGLYGDGDETCYFGEGDTSDDDSITALPTSAAPTAGETLDSADNSPPTITMDVAATFVATTTEDLSVTTATETGASAGSQTVLGSKVTNAGPAAGAITFTDTVPAGLAIDSAVAGDGTCTTGGQTVTCTITGLAAGDSAPVDVVVTPARKGSYTNTVRVAPAAGFTDPDAANNSATSTLSVASAPVKPPAPKCTVPSLKGTPQKVAEKLLKDLGCKVGKVKKAHSSRVAKGSVIKTSPKAGTYADGKKVSLTVSSGRASKKKKK